MPSKTEADYIKLLLSIIEHSGQTDFNEVATATGMYKSGKFVRQALNSIKTKYAETTTPTATPGSETKSKTGSSKTALDTAAPKTTSKKRGRSDTEEGATTKKSRSNAEKKKVQAGDRAEDDGGED